MLTQATKKFVRSLHQKKYRDLHQQFFVEGIKGVNEIINAKYPIEMLFTTEQTFAHQHLNAELISLNEMKQISSLKNPSPALAVCKYKKNSLPAEFKGLYFALDDVRDPGNLGTIIRLADWFGVSHIFCSPNSVDLYNPKVIQSTMGSWLRVNITYLPLQQIIEKFNGEVVGTFMNGENMYNTAFPSNCLLVLGNEANGISTEIESLCDQKIAIPSFGQQSETESLNVAMAASIITGEYFSQKTKS